MGAKSACAAAMAEVPPILECMSDGVAMLDTVDHAIVFANGALAAMVGRSLGELRSLPSFFALGVPTAYPAANDRPPGVLAPRFDLELLHASGRLLHVEVATSVAEPGR